MAGIKVEVKGINDLLRNIDLAKESTKNIVAAAGVAVVSKDVGEYAKANHPFQNQTGNLEASIHPLPVEIKGDYVIGYVQAGMEYAPHVEFGTSRSAPYPYLNPAVKANRENLRKTVAACIKRGRQVIKAVRS